MNKAIVLMLLLIQFSCTKQQKDSIILKHQFQAEIKYDFSSEQTLQTVIKYSGKEKSLNTLKSRGIKNPTILSKKSNIKAIVEAGKLQEEVSFPIKAACLISVENNGQKETPVNVIFHGICNKDSLPFFDMATGENLDRKYEMILLQNWQKNITQFKFSDQQLKAGNEFTMNNKIFMPMEGSEIEMEVKTTYKLFNIIDNRANFNITQLYTMSPKLMDNSFEGSGRGHGNLVYDVDNMIVVDYKLNSEMNLHKNLDSFSFDLTTKSGYHQSIHPLKK